MKKSIKFRVTGKVQGVGFRYATRKIANELDLGGVVRNRMDGDVEGIVCGSESGVDEFLAWLWNGPRHARVDGVEVEDCPEGELKEFTVIS